MTTASPPPATAESSSAASESPLAAILLLVTAMSVVPLMDGIAKYLSASYPVSQVVWARYFFHLLVLLPLVLWHHGPRGLMPRNPAVQVLRSAFLLLSTIFFFAAIALIPLADAIALVFVSPLLVTAFSPLILGEQVGLRRWSAVIVGFVGACIVFRPGFGMLQWGSLLALAAGSTYAFYVLMTRKLSGSAPPLVTLFYTALLGGAVMTAVMPFAWVAPSHQDLALMVAMGVIAACGHFLIIKAFEKAPASLLAPYGYSEIVMATLVGYVAFGDFPDHWTWIGIAIIVCSGIYISLREQRLRKTAVSALAGAPSNPIGPLSSGPNPVGPASPPGPGTRGPGRRDLDG